MNRKVVDIAILSVFDERERRYSAVFSTIVAQPVVEDIRGMSIVTMKNPNQIIVKIHASKDDGSYPIDDVIFGLRDLITKLESTKG